VEGCIDEVEGEDESDADELGCGNWIAAVRIAGHGSVEWFSVLPAFGVASIEARVEEFVPVFVFSSWSGDERGGDWTGQPFVEGTQPEGKQQAISSRYTALLM
jgi:hypothetical protein